MTRLRSQKGILYLGVERCRILNFLLQKRGVEIFQFSYFFIGIFLKNFYAEMFI